jgi:hypothetical protein
MAIHIPGTMGVSAITNRHWESGRDSTQFRENTNKLMYRIKGNNNGRINFALAFIRSIIFYSFFDLENTR